jgi:hypothetical protein
MKYLNNLDGIRQMLKDDWEISQNNKLNFLRADFSGIKMDDCLQILAKNT